VSPSKGQLCDRARHWASLRLDGELSELEAALLDAHLERCPGCRAFADEADGIVGALRAVALEPLEAPVVIPLRHRPRRVRALQTAVAVALVLAAAALGSLLGVANRESQTATPARHVAMIASADSPDTLRKLRRPTLVAKGHAVPRNRALREDV
jgi:ferric-dicitrate binding protein FerR (iron transport regulator)